jgi:hypothetical protein
MPSTSSKSPALLRIVSLLLATFLFIAMAEQDARHETRQRWLADARRQQETHLLAHGDHSRRTTLAGAGYHGSHGRRMVDDRRHESIFMAQQPGRELR